MERRQLTAYTITLQIPLTHVSIDLRFNGNSITIECIAKAIGQVTGVEMEALTGTTVAALTVYDMLKALKTGTMEIAKIELLEKHGGRSHS